VILLPFAVANNDLSSRHVDVLDAQTLRFHRTQAAAVPQIADQPEATVEMCREACNLVARQRSRQSISNNSPIRAE